MTKKIFAVMTLVALTASTAIAQEVLLIPDGSARRISAFSPMDGSVIDLDYIPQDFDHLSSPFNATSSGRGTIFVSDFLADAVFEYDFDGSFIRTVADASDGLDSIVGIEVFENSLYVTVFDNAGGLRNTIQRFDLETHAQTTWASNEVNGPYDILFQRNSASAGNAVVSNINTNDLEQYNSSGAFTGTFHESNGVTGIDFPEQLQETASGEILAGGFVEPAGIFRYDSIGNQLNYYNTQVQTRGIYELENGNILWSSRFGVFSLDTATGNSTLITDDGNFRYIELVSVVPEPASILILCIAAAAFFANHIRIYTS